MGNYFIKVGRLLRVGLLLTAFALLPAVSVLLPKPSVAQAAAPTGTGSIIVTLNKNPTSRATVTATRASQAFDVGGLPVKGTPETVNLTESTGPKVKTHQTYISPTLPYSGVGPAPTACGSGTANPENDAWYTWNIKVSGSATGTGNVTVNCGRTATVTINVTLAGTAATTGTIAGTATDLGKKWACTPSSNYYLTAPGAGADVTQGGTALPSDSKGAFTFAAQPGTYDLLIDCLYSANGENTLTEVLIGQSNVVVTAGKTTQVTLTAATADGTADCSSTDSSGNCKNSADDALDCGAGGWNWIVCMGIQTLQSAADKVDGLITSQLNVDTGKIFNSKNTVAYETAWNSFRIIAIALLVIAGLVMVTSQALGFEFLDAYTIRKILPRLLIAIIGISLSWPLLQFVINFFDVVGYDVRELIYAPFNAMAKSGGSSTLVLLGNPLSVIVAGSALFLVYGPALFTFLITAFLAAMVALFVLVVRQMAIIVLVILAPLAIACYILPNTQKAWKMWVDNFMGLMLMFPIVSALIAAGHVMSAVGRTGGAFEQFVSIIAYFAPYFMLPFAFRLATGVISTIAGIANDRSKGAFDRLKKARSNAAARNIHDMKTGNRFKGDSAFAKKFNATTEGIAAIPSAGIRPGHMKANMQAAMSRHQMDEAAEYSEKSSEMRSIISNDDFLRAGVDGKGDDDKVRQLLQTQDYGGYKGPVLDQAVAAIRAARRGTNSEVFETAATMALPATGTAFKRRALTNDAGQRTDHSGRVLADNEESVWIGGAGEMHDMINHVAGGDRVKAARMLGAMRSGASQARRFDISGGGFGAEAGTLEAQFKGELTAEQATTITVKQALEGQGGSYIAGARKSAVEAFAPAMLDNLKGMIASGDNTAISRELAKLAGRYDAMSQAAPESGEVLASQVLGQAVTHQGQTTTVREMIATQQESANSDFLDMRKEYGITARNGAAAADQAARDARAIGQVLPPPNQGPMTGP